MEHPGTMSVLERNAMLERAKRNPGETLILCPFGCGVERCNELGYCRHLVGWTIDKKSIEIRERSMEGRERTGVLIDKVEEDDLFISGTPFRTDKNGNKTPTPSLRVYRKSGKAPYRDDGKQFVMRPLGKEIAFEDELTEETEDALAAV